MISLGKFENKSGKMLLTDPCYKIGTWCSAQIDVEPGVWEAFVVKRDVENWGNRCCELIVVREGHDITKGLWDGIGADLGVDSGQLGVFDRDLYEEKYRETEEDKQIEDKLGWGDNHSLFYKKCANLTLSQLQAGVFSAGAVSSSGFGDGGYTGYTQENESGKAVAIKVIFISGEEEE